MRTNRRIPSVTLVLSLVAALALVGSSPAAAAKKPKPPPEPEWVWEVEVPMCSTEYKLCGLFGETTYTDGGTGDGVWVEVTTERDRGAVMSRFGFAVFKCEPGERCHPDYQGSDPVVQPPPVHLQGIQLYGHWWRDDPGDPCVFPGSCGELDAPDCMQCFLDGQHPYDDYRYFSFEVTVPGDFEDIEGEVGTWGNLDINLFNTREILLPEGEGDFHNIDGRVELLTADAISITRVDPNTWTVHVTVDPGMVFSEWYVGCFKVPNKKGDCPWVYKWPLDSRTSNELSFEVTWTRTTQ